VVDGSLWFEHCSQCREHRYVREIRIFGLPIWEKRGENHIGVVGRLRTDLGFPCEHEFNNRMHLVRIEARQLAERVVNENNFDEIHDFIAAMKRNDSE